MALLSTQTIDRSGTFAPSYAAVAASDTFAPGPNTFVHVKNAGGSSDTVTFVTPGNVLTGVAIADPTLTVPATTGDRMFGPIPGGYFADPTTGLVTMTHSTTTSVTCAVLNLTQGA
jgi:hypothetical protein